MRSRSRRPRRRRIRTAALPSGEIAPFDDVAAGDWYADSVTWLVENGIAQGKGDTFDPNGPVTREQVAALMQRFCALVAQ